MLNEFGYLIGVNRKTHQFEELSTKVHRVAAESYVQVEKRLHDTHPGGMHAEYYNVSFVKDTDIAGCRDLMRRINEEQDASTVIGICFVTTIIEL